MGDKALIYELKFKQVLKEAKAHIHKIEQAFGELNKIYNFPISQTDFHVLLNSNSGLAYADQIIYRFSKSQDYFGAKLFKSFLLYQGENVDRPFLDILNSLEKTKIVDTEEWFELREIRNEIAHEYGENEERGKEILNNIFVHKKDLQQIIGAMEKAVSK